MAGILARNYMTNDQKEELREYEGRLLENLNKTNWDEETKEKYYDSMMRYAANYKAMENYEKKVNALDAKITAIRDAYRKETDPDKQKILLEKYNKTKAEFDKVKTNYNYFEREVAKYENEAVTYTQNLKAELQRTNAKSRN